MASRLRLSESSLSLLNRRDTAGVDNDSAARTSQSNTVTSESESGRVGGPSPWHPRADSDSTAEGVEIEDCGLWTTKDASTPTTKTFP